MTGEDFYALGPLPTGDRQFLIDCRVNADGTQTYSFEASGPTTGPYSGSANFTFFETGELTIRPKPTEPGIPVGPADLLALSTEFSVNSAAGQVSGTKRLATPVEDGASYAGCGGSPGDSVIETNLPNLSYSATITTASGVFADRGRATFRTTLEEGFGHAFVHEFRETFTSSLGSPEQNESVLFGQRTPGGSFSQMSMNTKRVSPFVLYFPATARKVYAYIDGRGAASGSQTIRAVLYDRDPADGGPGAYITRSFEYTVRAGTAAHWQPLWLAPIPRLGAGVYWLGIQSGPNNGVARFAWNSKPNSRHYNIDLFADGASDPFGISFRDNQEMSIFAAGNY